MTATDRAGNRASRTVRYAVGDATAPTVTVTAPADGATFTQGQIVVAGYSCEDNAGGSGMARCRGPVASGAPIDTSTAGPHEFTVMATDKAGNEVAKTARYTVVAPIAPGPPAPPAPSALGLSGFAAGFTCIRYPASGPAAQPSARASFRFVLSEPATVTVAIRRRMNSGSRSRCPRVRPRGEPGRFGAPITVTVPGAAGSGRAEVGPPGTLVGPEATSARKRRLQVRRRLRRGHRRVRLAQVTDGARLAPGTYVASIAATTADGRRASAGTVKFWVLRPRKRG